MSSCKNIIDMGSYYAGTSFGFAAAKTGLPCSLFAETAELPAFHALEVQQEQLDAMSVFKRSAVLEHFPLVHAGDLMDRTLSQNIVSAPERIRSGFIAEVCRILHMLASEYRIRTVALDLAPGSAAADPEKRKILMRILRKLHPCLHENRQTLLLPFRLPVLNGCSAEEFRVFLRETMIPCVKVRLEIYPHECSPDADPRAMAGCLRFETGSVIFCYDADSGNRLLRAHLLPWLKYFALNAFRGPFFVCPYSHGFRLSAMEAGAFAELAEGFRKNEIKSGTEAHSSMS